jgi:hypothetical protein
VKRAKPDPDGITARLAGTAGRALGQGPLDVEAAVVELRDIAGVVLTCSVRWPGASVRARCGQRGWAPAMGRHGKDSRPASRSRRGRLDRPSWFREGQGGEGGRLGSSGWLGPG